MLLDEIPAADYCHRRRLRQMPTGLTIDAKLTLKAKCSSVVPGCESFNRHLGVASFDDRVNFNSDSGSISRTWVEDMVATINTKSLALDAIVCEDCACFLVHDFENHARWQNGDASEDATDDGDAWLCRRLSKSATLVGS